MSDKPKTLLDSMTKFRTVLVVLASFPVSLLGLWLCAKYGGVGTSLFPPFMTGVCVLVATSASKSAVEHLSNGNGLVGSVKALLSEKKDAPVVPPPPGHP